MKKPLLLTLALATATISATAAASNNEVYAGVGSTGIAVGYTRAINLHSGARLEVNALNLNGHLDDVDASYNAKVSMHTVGAYYDYFPFDSTSLRFTGGAIFGSQKIDLDARSNGGTFTVNGREYDATGESLYGSVKLPTAAPYIGIGTGHKASSGGLSLITDFGVSYGKPSVSLSATPSLRAAVGQSNLDAERSKVQDQVNKYALYPVIRIAIGYAF